MRWTHCFTCSFAPRTWWASDMRKWRWHCPKREPAGCRRRWWAASGAAALLSLDTHQSRKEQQVMIYTHTHTKTHSEKGYEALRTAERRHGKRCPRRSARVRCKPGWNGASATAPASKTTHRESDNLWNRREIQSSTSLWMLRSGGYKQNIM